MKQLSDQPRAVSPTRTLLGAFVGYLAIIVAVVLIRAGVGEWLGADGVYEPGGYAESARMEICVLALAVVAGALGGWLVFRIGGIRSSIVLGVMIFVAGITGATLSFTREAPGNSSTILRPAGKVDWEAATTETTNSVLYLYGLPCVELFGVIAGAKIASITSRRWGVKHAG